MTLVGINHEPELDGLIERLASEGRISMVELIVDGYSRTVPDLRRMIARFGVPYTFHNVCMSLGSVGYTRHDTSLVRAAARQLSPLHISEHLTFSRAGNVDLVQNLAVPRSAEMATLFARNIRRAIADLASPAPFLVENIASQWLFRGRQLSSQAFVSRILRDSGAHLLLDLHNLYADEVNHGWDATAFIDAMPLDIVDGVHVTGGRRYGRSDTIYLDSHDAHMPPRVWELLRHLMKRRAPPVIVLERTHDERMPAARFEREVRVDLTRLDQMVRREAVSVSVPAQRWRSTRLPAVRLTEAAQRQWLSDVATPSRWPRGITPLPGALEAVRAKYQRYVLRSASKAFPRFVERAPLSDDDYLEIYRGRDPLPPVDVPWLFAALRVRCRRLEHGAAWDDLLRIERAIAMCKGRPPCRLRAAAIDDHARRWQRGRSRREILDVEQAYFVRLRTGFAVGYPELDATAMAAARGTVLCVLRKGARGTPALRVYEPQET